MGQIFLAPKFYSSHILGKTGKRVLVGGGMGPFVADISKPQIKAFIQFIQGLSHEAGKELRSDCLEMTNYWKLAFPLGIILLAGRFSKQLP